MGKEKVWHPERSFFHGSCWLWRQWLVLLESLVIFTGSEPNMSILFPFFFIFRSWLILIDTENYTLPLAPIVTVVPLGHSENLSALGLTLQKHRQWFSIVKCSLLEMKLGFKLEVFVDSLDLKPWLIIRSAIRWLDTQDLIFQEPSALCSRIWRLSQMFM